MDRTLYARIESNLNTLFDKECPPSISNIMTSKDDVLDEFKKWYDFWNAKRPPNLSNPNISMNNCTKLLLMKIQICDNRILNICNELKRIHLYDDFVTRFKLSCR